MQASAADKKRRGFETSLTARDKKEKEEDHARVPMIVGPALGVLSIIIL